MSISYDATGIDGNGFKLECAPPGPYLLAIKEIRDRDKDGNQRLTQKGDPMVSVKCEIDDVPAWLGTVIWHNVTFMPKDKKGAGMAIQFLKVLGEPHQGVFEIEPSHWVGKRFKAMIKIDKDLNGNPRNAVSFLIDETTAEADVPF